MNPNLETWEKLENFIINEHQINNGVGWSYVDKALLYYNTGYEHYYNIPDWEKIRLTIIENYKWVKTDDDLLEAFHDSISEYSLFSRG